MFGCSPTQITRAGGILRALATEWRGLSAGAEGFLTGARRGLEGQQVVWGEQDSFQHVNNVQYVRWAESSRVNWVTHFAVAADHPDAARRWAELMTPRSTGLILKSIRVDYKLPLTYPDRVSVYHRLRHPPSSSPSPSSLILDAAVFSHRHRRVSARVEEDVVIYDYRAAKKTEMPAFMRGVLEETFVRQQDETARARRRIWELIRGVEGLENETWDRPGAVEDFGGAATAAKTTPEE
jgi:acyl-CoA thioesterase FadM